MLLYMYLNAMHLYYIDEHMELKHEVLSSNHNWEWVKAGTMFGTLDDVKKYCGMHLVEEH